MVHQSLEVKDGHLIIPTDVPKVPIIPRAKVKGSSYLNHLLDAIDDAVHEGLEHVGLIERVRVAHAHEQDVGRQPGDHVHHHAAGLQVWSRKSARMTAGGQLSARGTSGYGTGVVCFSALDAKLECIGMSLS